MDKEPVPQHLGLDRIERDEGGIADYAPTPLQPYAISDVGSHRSYVETRQAVLGDIVDERADELNMPDAIRLQMMREVKAAFDVRVERNTTSYERLIGAIGDRQLDETMDDIIQKARAGVADTQELLRLIKEFPEMLSVEFFKRYTVLDAREYRISLAMIRAQMKELQRAFHDAEVSILPQDGVLLNDPFVTETGAIVWKAKIADCTSRDSWTEVIVKHSALLVPVSEETLDDEANHIVLITDNEGHKMKLVPLSVSAYMRAADYKERAGYIPPTSEVRNSIWARSCGIGAGVIEAIERIDEIASQIQDPVAKAVYLESLVQKACTHPGAKEDLSKIARKLRKMPLFAQATDN